MKLFGISGYATGKKGDAVFAVNHGTQIVRQYQPIVTDKKSDAQVGARAKMKLMSQVAASVKPFIAIQRDGMKSPANLFISANYDLASYAGNEAQLAMEDVQFTKSSIALPAISAERENSKLKFELASDMSLNLDRVIYLVLSMPSNQELIPAASVVAEAAGVDGLFKAEVDDVEGDICVYAYGIKDNTTASRVKFSNLGIDPGQTVAKIIASRTLSASDYTATETRGLQLASGASEGESTGTNAVRVTLGYTSGSDEEAVFTGAGNYQVGDSVTVTCTPNNGYIFRGWYNAASQGTQVSANASYTFTAAANITLYARLEIDA